MLVSASRADGGDSTGVRQSRQLSREMNPLGAITAAATVRWEVVDSKLVIALLVG